MMIWKNSSWSVLGYLVPTSDAETSRRPTVQLQTGRSRRLGCFMQLPRAPGGPWRNVPRAKLQVAVEGDFWVIPRHTQLDSSSGLRLLGSAAKGSHARTWRLQRSATAGIDRVGCW